MYYLRILSVLMVMLIASDVYPQKENTNWYFGDHAGISFGSGNPVALLDGSVNTYEGCSTISSANGELLFYSDGSTVWNRQHQVMYNGTGLHGHYSSTQSALILRQPGSDHLYYLFTVDYGNSYYGLEYSIIDIAGDNGNGAVITKNNSLLINSLEKVTTILHHNKNAYWVVAHDGNSMNFDAFLLNSNGLNTSPVISSAGTYLGNEAYSGGSQGYMKASPDGSKIAYATYHMNMIEMVGFNPETGKVSSTSSSWLFPDATYGVEFSPNGRYLYISVAYDIHRVYQIGIETGISQLIAETTMTPGCLQLAPDGKIYIALFDRPSTGSEYLALIKNPDSEGNNCGFEENGFYLEGKKSMAGLPFMVQIAQKEITVSYSGTCFGDSTYFQAQGGQSNDSVIWNFGDPASGTNNIASGNAAWHIFSQPGTFHVTVTAMITGQESTQYLDVTILSGPSLSLGNDDTLCNSAGFQFSFGNQYASYLWQDGSQSPDYQVTTSGTYWLMVTDTLGCRSTDTVVYAFSTISVNLGSDIEFCSDTQIQLNAGDNFASYLWQDGSTNQIQVVDEIGSYWVKVSDQFLCEASDTIILFSCYNPTKAKSKFLTPNGDGLNDTFRVVFQYEVDFEMKVFDRWGRVLFVSNDYESGWDGRYKGKSCPNDVYFYSVQFLSKQKNPPEKKTLIGYITLMR